MTFTRRTETLAILLAIACSIWLVRYVAERNTIFECRGHGVEIVTTRAEVSRDSGLIFGTLPDGREVAIGRASLEGCRQWRREN